MKKTILDKDKWLLLNQIIFRNLKEASDELVFRDIKELSNQHKSKAFNYNNFQFLNREDVGKIIMILDNLKDNDYLDFEQLVLERIKWNRKDINAKA